MKEYNIAIVGNPNSGKTSIFNALTGSSLKVGNWAGVTVEKKEGSFSIDENTYTLVDLPGIYSLSSRSQDEVVAKNFIRSSSSDLILNVVDSTNLERNLYLTTILMELNLPVVLVLNKEDIAKQRGIVFNIDTISKQLGVPVISTTATDSDSIDTLKSFIHEHSGQVQPKKLEIPYPEQLQKAAQKIQEYYKVELGESLTNVEAIDLLENGSTDAIELKNKIDKRFQKHLGEEPSLIIAKSRYSFIKNILEKAYSISTEKSFSEKLDNVLLKKAFGLPFFMLVMYFVFWFTQHVGGSFIDFFDIFVGAFVEAFGNILSVLNFPGWLISILAGGVGVGIQTAATFIPVVFAIFLMISILEQSGYMARAAFTMDKFMRLLGLPGKAFIPMIVGFGCGVPAILAARTLESKRDRILTIFLTPLMSCSARLPVYTLFVAAFFSKHAGTIVFSLYLVGIVLAVITGLLLKNTLFKGKPAQFIMELPPYSIPGVRQVSRAAFRRTKSFILKAGKYIVIATMILGFLNTIGTDGSFGNEDTEKSVLTGISKFITPVFTPMGIQEDNWEATTALFSGIFAKEAVVGTLTALYQQKNYNTNEDIEEAPYGMEDFLGSFKEAFISIPNNLAGLADSMLDPLGLSVLSEESLDSDENKQQLSLQGALQQGFSNNPFQAYAYLLFILIYFPCVAVFGTMIREIGKAYALFSTSYLTLLAWCTAVIFYQVTVGHSLIWILIPAALLISTFIGIRGFSQYKR